MPAYHFLRWKPPLVNTRFVRTASLDYWSLETLILVQWTNE